MCDTIVALGNSTIDGDVLFGKNSDREPNEAQEIVMFLRQKHPRGIMVKCTYIEIPQVEETFQVLLSKPFWMWGAEMGSNEFGVTIGNEAVFTRIPYDKKPGLIGMDHLRLALERSKTAFEALETITSLLEKYGQGGNCGFAHELYYHNSFLIADTKEAWVLETSGKEWAAEKVKDVRSISNGITIGSHWDLASPNLVTYAIQKGWCKNAADFSFSRCYSEPIYTTFSDSRKRQVCTTRQLILQKGKIDVKTMMNALREHSGDSDKWSPDKGITGADVCMHAGWGPIRASQTAGSMVSQLYSKRQTHWVTGTAAPCTSIFKPVWFDSGLPKGMVSPDGKFNKNTVYWAHELLHREILKEYPVGIKVIKDERNSLEDNFIAEAKQSVHDSGKKRLEFTDNCFSISKATENKWVEIIQGLGLKNRMSLLSTIAWKKFNKEAEMP
jgi:secernin